MELKCLKTYCKTKVKLTDNEIESYNHLIKSGFILSKFCDKHKLEHRLSYDMAKEIINKDKILSKQFSKSIYDPVTFLFKIWMNENYGIDKMNKFKADMKEKLEKELNKNE